MLNIFLLFLLFKLLVGLFVKIKFSLLIIVLFIVICCCFLLDKYLIFLFFNFIMFRFLSICLIFICFFILEKMRGSKMFCLVVYIGIKLYFWNIILIDLFLNLVNLFELSLDKFFLLKI